MIGLLGGKRWDDPVTEDPKAGSMEIWSFANTTGDVHPIHVHLVRFQVLNRQPFNVKTYLQTGKLVLTGIPMPPETNERPAWKDTIKTYPGYITRVIQKFDLPAGTSTTPGQEFRYVWHCHILEHEDNEMMAALQHRRITPLFLFALPFSCNPHKPETNVSPESRTVGPASFIL